MTASPWSMSALLRFVTLNGAAAAVMVVGWVGVSGRVDPAEQLVWLNLSIGGLLVSLWANARWFLDGRRAVGLRARALRRPGPDETATSPPAVRTAVADTDALVAGEGLRRYHRRACPLAAGRVWPSADRADHRAAGRAPCGVCHP